MSMHLIQFFYINCIDSEVINNSATNCIKHWDSFLYVNHTIQKENPVVNDNTIK